MNETAIVRGTLIKMALVIASFLAVAVIYYAVKNRAVVAPELEEVSVVSNRPVVVSANGYLGSDACQKCHQEQFGSWHASYHRTMTQVISPQSAPDAIRDQSVRVEGQSYEFQRDGDKYFVELNDPTVRGEERRRELVMMTGSHHMHVFWYESDFDHTPAQLPIIYLRDQQRWIPRRSAFLQPPDEPAAIELGRWNQTCSVCHSTHPRQRLNTESRVWDTQVADFGIACEACHGPGEQHVAVHERDQPPVVDPIVNPSELSHQAKSDVCGQCHGIGLLNFDAVSESEYFEDGSTFRPGKTIAEEPFCTVVQASPDHWESATFKRFATSERTLNGHFWPDGEVRVSGREYNGLVESPCFQRGEMSCMSCHQMHEDNVGRRDDWKDDQLAKGMRGDNACIQCHAKYAELGSAHTHHAVGSTGSQCMNCHMPHTVYGLLKTIRSHTISSPSVKTTIQTGRQNACNLCHLDRTLKWSADHLNKWYDQEKPKLTKDETSTAASVLHLLKGDAAQRAIQASAFNWVPAREVSGTEWMKPFLLIGMDDPYDAVRIISERSYGDVIGSRSFPYHFLGPPKARSQVVNEALEGVKIPSFAGKSDLLFDESGSIDMKRLKNLLERRNSRLVELME